MKHPLTGKLLGHIVEIFGEGEVRAVTDGKDRARRPDHRLDQPDRARLPGRPAAPQFKVVHPVADKAICRA